MSESGEALPVNSAREMLEHVRLVDVVYRQFGGERHDDAGSIEPEGSNLSVLERHSSDRIEVQCQIALRTSEAKFDVVAVALYELDRDLALEVDVVKEFVERVGVMAVYPYLREGVSALASRLRVPVPTLGLLTAGRIELERVDPLSGEETNVPGDEQDCSSSQS